MAKMTECKFKGQILGINEAIDIKYSAPITSPDFRCTECDHPVRPHRAGGNMSAHFEHLERNPACSQSHGAR